jgi:hypothetical protein
MSTYEVYKSLMNSTRDLNIDKLNYIEFQEIPIFVDNIISEYLTKRYPILLMKIRLIDSPTSEFIYELHDLIDSIVRSEHERYLGAIERNFNLSSSGSFEERLDRLCNYIDKKNNLD